MTSDPARRERVRELAAERGRRHRRLRKQGCEVYDVRANATRLSEALVRAGLPPADAEDRAKVEAALDRLIGEWVRLKLL